MMPDWARHAIWWSVYPLGACGAPVHEPDLPGVHHRLARLEGWLDHLISLGCNGLALGPVWASATHGYDVTDHLAIDPRLGDDADFDRLVAVCRSRGIRVLLDGVFNHVSSAHRIVSESPAWLRRDAHHPDGWSRFEGHDGLVELDHGRHEVADYVTGVMNHWLDRGADGWRLDAAYRVPTAFWSAVLPRVRARHPGALIVAELLHGDYGATAEKAGFDEITQYELWKAVWSALKDRNPHELKWALERHDGLAGRTGAWTFVGNHDVTRIATQVGPAAARVATAIIMTLAGTPAIYYGDELAFTGLKEERAGGDDAIRPELRAYPPDATGPAGETLRATGLAVRLRRTHPWLVDGRTRVTAWDERRLVWRTTGEPGCWIEAELDVGGERPGLRVTDGSGELLVV